MKKNKAGTAAVDQERKMVRVHIRWTIRRDMPEVLEIEEKSSDYPWCEEDFLRCLRQGNCIGMAAEQGGKVVGFMIYEMYKTKLHILNFAVHPDYRLCGIGRKMAEKLFGKLSDDRRTRVTVEVREISLDGQYFFRAVGFRATGVSRQFFTDSGEDAYLMEYRLPTAEEDASPLVEPLNRVSGFYR